MSETQYLTSSNMENSPKSQNLQVAGVDITTDEEGRYNLNALHKASGEKPEKAPAKWARSKQAQELVDQVSHETGQICLVSKGGRNGGTYAHELLAVSYAGWISPAFQLKVNKVFLDFKSGSLVRVEAHLPGTLSEMMQRDHGMLRMLSHKVTNIEKALPGIIEEYLASALAQKVAEHAIMFRHGVTAKQVWDDFKLPGRLRGSTVWLGNRLAEMGCLLDGELRAQRGVIAVRLFDPDRSRVCMKNGLFLSAQAYASEKQGQGRLRLVPTNPGADQ